MHSVKVIQALYGLLLLCATGFAMEGVSKNPDDLRYLYYTGIVSSTELIFTSQSQGFNGAPFRTRASVVIIIDGFLSNYTSPMSQTTKNGFLERDVNRNVIVVDWGELSGSRVTLTGDFWNTAAVYSAVLENIGPAATRLAAFIDFIIREQEVSASEVHIVGHSLGAHLAGATGRFLRENHQHQLGRISGLDPAGPFFSLQPDAGLRLEKTDATFVDIYHSNRGNLGDSDHKTGSINVYINGGDNQPGCEIADQEPGMQGYCSHSFSWKFYNLASGTDIQGCPCSGFACQCNTDCGHVCEAGGNIVLGEHCPTSATGAYHVSQGPIE